jgi:hypothetical protein
MANGGGTVVEHSPHHPMVEGSIPVSDGGTRTSQRWLYLSSTTKCDGHHTIFYSIM